MSQFRQIIKKTILMIIGMIIIIGASVPVKAEWHLTQEEKAYIAESTVIKAVSVDGAAPIQYADSNGVVQGISKRVLEEIADMTGLAFEYELYDSLDKALNSNAEIYFGMPVNYAPSDMPLSQPFLKSETILYINSSLDLEDLEKLDDKIHAAVIGSALPEGVKEENVLYFNTREESLDAVEKGKADYVYGNAYSIAFYTLQNDYKNIITIPQGKESREYCVGFLKDNDLLYSIINKSISEIEESKMQTLILDATSRIERKITFPMIINSYGKQIFLAIFVVISILLSSVVSSIRINNKLKIQNKRHEILAQISNEYLYEYFAKNNHIDLSDKCIQLFGTQKQVNKVINILKQALSNNNFGENISILQLPLANGEVGIFKTISLSIYSDKGNLDSIIGKLIDISEETAEKEKLITKSQRDGLSGLYNAITAKELIVKSINNKNQDKTGAFMLIDCDKLKEINDTFGHLVGNQVLEHIAGSLRFAFSDADIIGRIGGDEFCVYIKDIPSIDFIQEKYEQLSSLINKEIGGAYVTVSIGIALLNNEKTYEDLFKQADDALYQAKDNGRAQIVIYSDK